MAIILVTYDLRQPIRDYDGLHDYLRSFQHCKSLESVWLLDTQTSVDDIRNAARKEIDEDDKLFVVRLARDWKASQFECGVWLSDSSRNW